MVNEHLHILGSGGKREREILVSGGFNTRIYTYIKHLYIHCTCTPLWRRFTDQATFCHVFIFAQTGGNQKEGRSQGYSTRQFFIKGCARKKCRLLFFTVIIAMNGLKCLEDIEVQKKIKTYIVQILWETILLINHYGEQKHIIT